MLAHGFEYGGLGGGCIWSVLRAIAPFVPSILGGAHYSTQTPAATVVHPGSTAVLQQLGCVNTCDILVCFRASKESSVACKTPTKAINAQLMRS